MSSWRKSAPLAALVAAAILAAQLAVPISRLADGDDATRFGWQMFSGSRGAPHFVVSTQEGNRDITLSDYVLRQRVEIDLVESLPPHLCETVEGAIRVDWDGGEYKC